MSPADPDPQRKPYRVFDADVARTVQHIMREVVQEDHGTGKIARIPGLDTGGKTGTAQKASPTGGYSNRYLGSFVSFVPAIAPQYIILVMIDEPEPCHYGGVVAAPAVKDVTIRMLSYLGRMPEGAMVAQRTPPPAPASCGPVATVAPSAADKAILDIAKGHQGGGAGAANVAFQSIPDFSGMPLRKAVEILVSKGIVPRLEGQGLIVNKQTPAAGMPWPTEKKTEFVLWLTRPS